MAAKGMIAEGSIARTLTRMNMLVSTTALLIACVGFVTFDILSSRERLVQTLTAQADVVGAGTASALLFDDSEAAGRMLSAFQNSPNIISATLLKADGQALARYGRDGDTLLEKLPEVAEGQREAHWFRDSDLLVGYPVVFQGKMIGCVYLQSDLQALHRRLQRYAVIAGIVLILSLIAALVVSSFYRRAVADPIVALAELARMVSRDKNYSVRVPIETRRGEVATLVVAFNEMLDQIQQQTQELRKAHDELEDRVEQRTAELMAANKELEAFSYSVSHDLRAPLRSIDGFSQALVEDYSGSLDKTAVDYLQRIRAAAQRMSGLIDDMLNLARVTRSEVHREAIDLSAVASNVAEELKQRNPERKVEFSISSGALANGDIRLLRIALENLI
ncbi:MAG: CHASE sensor domain-containing protein, partial [Candidatus Korobacteraceae bacterium]